MSLKSRQMQKQHADVSMRSSLSSSLSYSSSSSSSSPVCSSTPGAMSPYSTTPGGGTRIMYDRQFLLDCRNSPLARSPLQNLPIIPGVTCDLDVPRAATNNSTTTKKQNKRRRRGSREKRAKHTEEVVEEHQFQLDL